MKRICSVCKKELGEKSPLDDKSETHTLCLACMEIYKKEIADYKIKPRISYPDVHRNVQSVAEKTPTE